MAGLYIHIPFCTKACHYCNFHFSTNLKNKSSLVDAIGIELKQQAGYFDSNEKVQSIYLGGGTPSLLSEVELEQLITNIHSNYHSASDVEFTIECNPDDINSHKLQHFKSIGVNRLSIGVQSFDDSDLIILNRSHHAQQAIQAIHLAAEHGFEKLTIDLMYGLPNQDLTKWRKNLDIVSSLPINHLSCYNLTVEEKTALRTLIQKNKIAATDEVDAVSHFNELVNWSKQQGFEHYEISNFAKDKHYSKHNTAYWKGHKYLGIGPSAHSFDGRHTRRNNIANNAEYLRCITTGKDYFEIENLDTHQQFNEFVLTRLRTMWGIQTIEVKEKFGEKFHTHLLENISPFVNDGSIEFSNHTITLTATGKLVADHITSELFLV